MHSRDNKIKVFYDFQVACSQRFGGVSRYHYELMSQLNKRDDCQCDMFSLFNKSYYLGEIPGNYSLKRGLLSDQTVNRINKLSTLAKLAISKYDIIHPTWYADYFPKKHRAKIVITIHDLTQELFQEGKEHIVELKKNYIYKADHIIAISKNTKADILKLYPDIPSDKISVVYHGTNHLPKPEKSSGWICPDRYILFVGARSDYKNGMLLIKELSDFVAKNHLSIVFAGGGGLTNDEKQMIKNHNLENNVIQRDVTDAELAYLYHNAACFIYPSLNEGFGFPILEAFDNDCPVICSKTSCFPEIAGDAALYFELGQNGYLGEVVQKLMDDNDLRIQLINKGRERLEFFNWDNTASQTLEVYKRVLGMT